jgi:hypothetical protein
MDQTFKTLAEAQAAASTLPNATIVPIGQWCTINTTANSLTVLSNDQLKNILNNSNHK